MGPIEDSITITLSGAVAQRLRSMHHNSQSKISAAVQKILAERLEDMADLRAIEKAENASSGKPLIDANDLYRECGL